MGESSRGSRPVWASHLLILAVVCGGAISIGIAIIKSDFHSPNPWAALASLIIGGLFIAGAIAYAVISTALLGIRQAVAVRKPQAAPSRAGSKIALVLLVHVVAIVAVIYGIPKYWSIRNQRHDAALLRQSEARLPALRTCFELRRWKLDWGDGQNGGTLVVEGTTGAAGNYTAYFAGQNMKNEAVVATGKEDVTLRAYFLHAPAEPRPSAPTIEVRCPSGRRIFSAQQQTEHESVNISESVLVSPLVVGESP